MPGFNLFGTLSYTPVDGSGKPYAGAVAYVYRAATTTPITVYQRSDLTVPHANPVQADANGVFPIVWADSLSTYDYRVVIKTTAQVQLHDYDAIPASPYELTQSVLGGTLYPALPAEAGLVVNDWHPYGIVDRYGTNTTPGTTDMTAAFAAACASGFTVEFLPYATYRINSMTTVTGKVSIDGNNATIKSDVMLLKNIDGTGSTVKNLTFAPVTVRYTIKRDTSVWTAVAAAVTQKLDGYMPTTQDTDVWGGWGGNNALIEGQVNPFVFPAYGGLWFTVSSGGGAANLEVSGIHGYLVSIVVEGYSNSAVHDCAFGASALEGGILFWNGLPTNYANAAVGYTIPRGVNNRIVNNVVRYSTYCGIAIVGNDNFRISGNSCHDNGESGIKIIPHDGGAYLTTAAASTLGVITNNNVFNNYYDGIDGTCVYGTTGFLAGQTVINGNNCSVNRATGITVQQALNMVISSNVCSSNGATGIRCPSNFSTVTGNLCIGNCAFGPTGVNNQWSTTPMFDIELAGDGIVATGNTIKSSYTPYTYAYSHFGASGADPTAGAEGIDSGNWVAGGQSLMSVAKNINVFSKKGTWTPGIFGSTGAGTATYSTNTGSWSLEGDRIVFSGHLVWTGATGATGVCRISLTGISSYSGNAYVANALANDYGGVTFSYVTYAGITGQLTGRVPAGQSYIQLAVQNNGTTTDLAAAFQAAGELVFSGSFAITGSN